jgi:uncharacterized damage-inducible protein DinB
METQPESGRGEPGPLQAAALHVFSQCERLLGEVTDQAYRTPSATIRGGTIGKHLRHVLDHYSALFNGVESAPVVYDRRERNVAMEADRGAARAAIEALRRRLGLLREADLSTPVQVRVMVDAGGGEAELQSSLGRELAFATHHAVHHQAMMRAIAEEFGAALHADFGKAPSTINHEQGAPVNR